MAFDLEQPTDTLNPPPNGYPKLTEDVIDEEEEENFRETKSNATMLA